MSKKKPKKPQVWSADKELKAQLAAIARAEAKAIAKRRSVSMAAGLSPNEIAQRIVEARGTNMPAFSVNGRPKIVSDFQREIKASEQKKAAKLPVAKKPQAKIAKQFDENGPQADSGRFDPKGQHPGFTRTA